MLNLLLIEDNPGDAYLIQELFKASNRESFAVTNVTTLTQAKKELQEKNFDLIWVDLGLPDSFGIETILTIRKQAPHIPSIVLTGVEDESVGIQALKAGAQDYILKGNLSTDLLERVCLYAIERQQGQERILQSAQFLKSTIDALSAHIAIVNETGKILAVNQAWREFAEQNQGNSFNVSENANYLDACYSAKGEEALQARQFAQGILKVLNGKLSHYEMEYACHNNDQKAWYHGKITPFPGDTLRCVVVAHENITSRKLAEEALRRSESLFRKVFDILPVGISITDAQGRLTKVNPMGKKIWGASPLVGLKELGVFKAKKLKTGESMRAGDWPLVQTIKEGATILNEPLEIEAFDGIQRTILNSSAPLLDNAGNLEGALVLNLDISEQRKMENALRESEEQLRLIFDTSPNFVFIKNNKGRYLSANRAMVNFYGIPAEAMYGKTDQELTDMLTQVKQETSNFSTFDQRVLSQGQSVTIPEEPIHGKDGETRWFRTIKTPISLPSSPNCLLGIAIDITEQHELQQKTRNSEERLRTILNNLTSKILLLDKDLKILWANRFASDLVGKTNQELLGVSCNTICDNYDEGCPGCPVRLAVETCNTQITTHQTSDGKTWRTLGCPILDDHGNIINVVEVAEEITEIINLESKLQQAQKIESLGTLAGGIAHDFNNILTAILGFTEICRSRSKEDAQMTEDLEEIYNAGLRAKELVGQILTFSRRADVEVIPLHIPRIIKEALKLIRSTIPTSVEIVTDIDSEVGYILADPTQIHQIVMNLCTNASHAMEPYGGKMEVKISEYEPDEQFFSEHPRLIPGRYIELLVSDTGCGMSPEILVSIFDPYFTTKEHGEGTGLGLAVSLGIVNESGGEILVESEQGKGSVFKVLFPVVDSEKSPSGKEVEALLQPAEGHILLVDDEPTVLKITKRFLEKSGYQVTAFSESGKALEQFSSTPDEFDLVLSDVTMPKMTGDQLAEKILKIRQNFPILLMTGFTKNINETRLQELGVRALLIKPVSRNVLLLQLQSLLKESEM